MPNWNFAPGVKKALSVLGRFNNKPAEAAMRQLLDRNPPWAADWQGKPITTGMLRKALEGGIGNPNRAKFINTLLGIQSPAFFNPEIGWTPYAAGNLDENYLNNPNLGSGEPQNPPPGNGGGGGGGGGGAGGSGGQFNPGWLWGNQLQTVPLPDPNTWAPYQPGQGFGGQFTPWDPIFPNLGGDLQGLGPTFNPGNIMGPPPMPEQQPWPSFPQLPPGNPYNPFPTFNLPPGTQGPWTPGPFNQNPFGEFENTGPPPPGLPGPPPGPPGPPPGPPGPPPPMPDPGPFDQMPMTQGFMGQPGPQPGFSPGGFMPQPRSPAIGPSSIWDVFQSSIPVMEAQRDKNIAAAASQLGMGGNRFSSSALESAQRIGAETALEQNQMLHDLMYRQGQSDLDRALQASQFGAQLGAQGMQFGLPLGQAVDQMAQDRFGALMPFGQFEQQRADQLALMPWREFMDSRKGYLPELFSFMGGQGSGTYQPPITTTTAGSPGLLDYAGPIAQIASLFAGG